MTEPTRTVTDGRLVIGEIFEAEDGFRATDKDGADLGTFPTIERARSAIMEARIAERSMTTGWGR